MRRNILGLQSSRRLEVSAESIAISLLIEKIEGAERTVILASSLSLWRSAFSLSNELISFLLAVEAHSTKKGIETTCVV